MFENENHADLDAHSEIFTSLGTIVYYDELAGALRHGDPKEVGSNVRLTWCISRANQTRHIALVFCAGEETCQLSWADGSVVRAPRAACSGYDGETSLDVLPIGRGLVALRHRDRFFSAEPDGRVTALEGRCGVREAFLISDRWRDGTASPPTVSPALVERREIAKFVVDARVRARVCSGSSAKKVLIYGYPLWSHGRVYFDLCVRLYELGYILDIINWQQSHSEYISELVDFYDLILTSPDGVRNLVDNYGIPAARIVLVLHHEMDTRALIQDRGIDVFDTFAGYGVVSDFLFCASMVQGIRREPAVVGLGINFDEFFLEVAPALRTVGYASSMAVTTFGVEWKRGHLARTATEKAGLDFIVAGATERQQSFVDMPDFYHRVDAVVTSSLTEAAQLPVMEAAAAGRLVICTPVGHFPQKAYEGAGILAPVHPDKFVDFVAESLRFYRENPEAYVQKCRDIQRAAERFDWRYKIQDWVDFLENSFGESAEKLVALAGSEAASGRTAAVPDLIRTARRLAPLSPASLTEIARSLLNAGDREHALCVALWGLSSALEADSYEIRPPNAEEANLLDVIEIAANHHSKAKWNQGKVICEWLAIEREIPSWVRNNARRNLRWYACNAEASFPSAIQSRLDLPSIDGFYPGNFSICRMSSGYAIAVRFSNAKLADSHFGLELSSGQSAVSRIYLGELSPEFRLVSWRRVFEPVDFPAPESTKYLGFEDPRIFFSGGELFCLCTVCQLNPESIGQMILSKIVEDAAGTFRLSDWRVISSIEDLRWEKNWMPFVRGDGFGFIYSVGPTRILDEQGKIVTSCDPRAALEGLKGGSQAVPFDGGWLALTHEWEWFDNRRFYFHRFVWFDENWNIEKLTGRFFFCKSSVEFAAGLCWDVGENRLLASFSLEDREPFIMMAQADEVRAALGTLGKWRTRGWEATSALFRAVVAN